MTLKEYLKKKLSARQIIQLKRAVHNLRAIWFTDDLNKLAQIYQSDKYGRHRYTIHYHTHFSPYKNKKIKLLEIGVGGYDNPYAGGASLKMWKRYFSKANVFAIDIYDKSALQEHRIKIYQGSQVDENFLNRVCNEIGNIDIIIDDGSHINEHVVTTFNLLFPKLNKGGLYVVEDTQTSYFEEYGGDSKDVNNEKTMMNFFKPMVDSVNKAAYYSKDLSMYSDQIESIHFYRDLIFIEKES